MVQVFGIDLSGNRLQAFVYANLFVSNVIFGISAVVYRLALSSMTPTILSFYRQLGATPVLVLLAFFMDGKVPNWRRDLLWTVACGFIGVFLNQLAFAFGVAYAGAILAPVVHLATPPITSALAIILKIEKFSPLKIVGITLSVVGAVTMVVKIENMDLTSQRSIGIFILIVQCFLVAVYLIMSKKLLEKYPPVTVTAAVYVTGMPFMALTAAIFEREASAWHVNTTGFWAVMWAVFLHSVVGYMMMSFSNKHTESSVVAAAGTINPLTATILASIVLGERLDFQDGVGAILIVSGLAVVTYSRYRDSKAQTAETTAPPGEPKVADEADKAAESNGSDDSAQTNGTSTPMPDELPVDVTYGDEETVNLDSVAK